MDQAPATFELRNGYLLVVGHGKRDNLLSMTQAAELIYAKMKETNSSFLLVDYRDLQINVHLAEAFNIVKRYETAQPDLKTTTIAAVFDKKGLEFGNYWKEIASKRGFLITIFEDFDTAEKWLLHQIQNKH